MGGGRADCEAVSWIRSGIFNIDPNRLGTTTFLCCVSSPDLAKPHDDRECQAGGPLYSSGWTVGRLDGRTVGRLDGWTLDCWMVVLLDGWTVGRWIVERLDGWTVGRWIVGRLDGWTYCSRSLVEI